MYPSNTYLKQHRRFHSVEKPDFSRPGQSPSLQFHLPHLPLKGVFSKNERGYRLTAKNTFFWSLLILWNINNLRMRRKIIDDDWMWYLNDLFGIKLIFYDLSWILQLSEFLWTLRSSIWFVSNNFLLIDATERSKIISDQKHLFFRR